MERLHSAEPISAPIIDTWVDGAQRYDTSRLSFYIVAGNVSPGTGPRLRSPRVTFPPRSTPAPDRYPLSPFHRLLAITSSRRSPEPPDVGTAPYGGALGSDPCGRTFHTFYCPCSSVGSPSQRTRRPATPRSFYRARERGIVKVRDRAKPAVSARAPPADPSLFSLASVPSATSPRSPYRAAPR
jgi:hypothetical protein